MTEEEELAHLRAPSADPKQRQVDYWARRAERAEAENERLRALLEDTPVLVIDARAAKLLGEDVALAYRAAVMEWHPKLKAALEQNGDDHG